MARRKNKADTRVGLIHLGFAVIISVMIMSMPNSKLIMTLRNGTIEAAAIVYGPIQWLENIAVLQLKYNKLEQKYIKNKIEIHRLRTLEQENKRLRKALGFTKIRDINVIPANVLSNSYSEMLTSVFVDQGKEKGVHLHDAVVDSEGNLVGKVVAVSENNALIQLLSDKNFKVSVRITQSRNTGILENTLSDGFVIRDIPKNYSIISGDSVVTSGYSDLFPEHLFVGYVASISPLIEDYIKSVHVDVATDFNRLEEVFILRKND